MQATYNVSNLSVGPRLRSLDKKGRDSSIPGSSDFSQKKPKFVHRKPNLTGSVHPSKLFKNISDSGVGSSSASRRRKTSSSLTLIFYQYFYQYLILQDHPYCWHLLLLYIWIRYNQDGIKINKETLIEVLDSFY